MTEPRSLEQPSSSGRPFADNLDVRLRDLPPLAGQSDLSGPCPDPYKEPEAGSILVEHNTENSQAAHNGNFRGMTCLSPLSGFSFETNTGNKHQSNLDCREI